MSVDDIKGKVITNRAIVSGFYLLRVRLAKPMGTFKPGQFVMLKIPGNDIFLRRPFSIYAYGKNVLSILYKVVGKGTGYLGRVRKDQEVYVLGPLGNGFRIVKRDTYAIVAGGIGIAGVHSLIKTLKSKAVVFYGCTNKDEVALVNDLLHYKPEIATIDGSSGFRGNVVDLLKKQWGSIQSTSIEVFACGPDGMVKSLRAFLKKRGTACQVLVEERMACGLGLCFGCVKKTPDEKEPYKRVCKEGPVFNLWEIYL